jgi:uncharacterized protein (TIGR03083 family)
MHRRRWQACAHQWNRYSVSDIWQLVDDERRDLVAFLRSLSEPDWEHDSLCDGWRNKEVVGHLVWVANFSKVKATWPMIRALGNIDRMIDREAKRYARPSVIELTELLEATIGSRRLPPKTKPDGLLADLFVHHQDMRRPIGQTRHVDEERLRAVLEQVIRASGSRCRGITIRATDMVFSEGKGPVLEGLAEALIMVVSGRNAVLTDLTGPGFEAMAARLAS